MYLRHGAYYYVKHRKWVRLSANIAEAMEMYGRIVAGSSGGGMAQLIDEALPAITRDVKPSTARQYTAAAMRLREVLVEFAPHEVRQRDVAAIKQHYADTPNMANRLLTVLRLVMAYAVERQIIDANPCTGIKPHKEAKRDRLMTAAEFDAIRSAATHKAIPIVMALCYLTGQRINDVLGIRWSDVSDKGIQFEQQKTGNRLVVAMTDDLRSVLAEAERTHPRRCEWLLYTRGNWRYSYRTIHDGFAAARERAGVPDVTLHDIRAKSGTDAEEQGLNPTELLGHSDGRQTRRYLRGRKAKQARGPKMERR